MSGLYGYSDALSQGSAFNARVKNYNDGVLLANQNAITEHGILVKGQKKKVADDTLREREDGAEYAVMDTKSFLTAGAGVGELYSGVKKSGVAGYISDSTKGRLNTIQNTTRQALANKPKPPPVTMELGEANDDGTYGDALVQAGDAGENAAKAGEETIESSGMGTGLIKGGLKLASRGAIGDAGLTVLSEVGGKVLGDFSGGKDIVRSFANLYNGSGIFAGESTADKFTEVGAAADLVGTIFPPAEIVGGVLGLVGGAIDTWDDIKADMDKKSDDSKNIPPPKQTAIKVSPAFSQMGLVASAPISAKQSITGS